MRQQEKTTTRKYEHCDRRFRLPSASVVPFLIRGISKQIIIPREAVLSDQRGDFVYVVDADNRTERRGVALGQPQAGSVVIMEGLKEGERVVLEGIQRVQAVFTRTSRKAGRAR